MIILVSTYTKWPKLIFFTLFCLISVNIVRKYSHFGDFSGKSVQKLGGNGRYWIFVYYFYTKPWKSNESISKCPNGAIVNHICFKNHHYLKIPDVI